MKIPYLEKRFEKLDVVKFCQIILLIVYLDQLLSKSQEVLLFYNQFKLDIHHYINRRGVTLVSQNVTRRKRGQK